MRGLCARSREFVRSAPKWIVGIPRSHSPLLRFCSAPSSSRGFRASSPSLGLIRLKGENSDTADMLCGAAGDKQGREGPREGVAFDAEGV